jgi:hypothetical protein
MTHTLLALILLNVWGIGQRFGWHTVRWELEAFGRSGGRGR